MKVTFHLGITNKKSGEKNLLHYNSASEFVDNAFSIINNLSNRNLFFYHVEGIKSNLECCIKIENGNFSACPFCLLDKEQVDSVMKFNRLVNGFEA